MTSRFIVDCISGSGHYIQQWQSLGNCEHVAWYNARVSCHTLWRWVLQCNLCLHPAPARNYTRFTHLGWMDLGFAVKYCYAIWLQVLSMSGRTHPVVLWTAPVATIAVQAWRIWIRVSLARRAPYRCRAVLALVLVSRQHLPCEALNLETVWTTGCLHLPPAPPVHSPSSLRSLVFSVGRYEHLRHVMHHNAINNSMTNPRLPPFPHPTTVSPMVQIKQTLSIPGIGSTGGSGNKTKHTGKSPAATTDLLCVATHFAPSRGWLAGSPGASREKTAKAGMQLKKRRISCTSWFFVGWKDMNYGLGHEFLCTV